MVQITTTLSRLSQIASPPSVSPKHQSNPEEYIKSDTSLSARSNMGYHTSRRKARPSRETLSINPRKRIFGQLEIVHFNDGHRSKTLASLRLPSWIHARRYQFCLSRSYQGWQQTLQSYAIFSYDDLVFQYSMDGNVSGLQNLFQAGKASPFVVDPDGRSPLHYAALYARPQACLFLIEYGADSNLRTSWSGEFGSSDLDLGDGWYPYPGYIRRAATFCGWPAYSTPLHILSSVTSDLLYNGRAALADIYAPSNQDIIEDIRSTLEVLVCRGEADLFLQDQFKMNVFHSYRGPSDDIKWLERECEEEFGDMANSERLEISLFRALRLDGSPTETLYEFLPEGIITNEVATYESELCDGMPLLQLASLIHIMHAIMGSDLAISGKTIQELIAAGSDLHKFDSKGYTIILYMMGMFGDEARTHAIKKWLDALHTAGVDLVEYGRVENALHDEGKTSWVFEIYIGDELGFNNSCRMELTKLQIGQSPNDLLIEFEDLYVSAGLAANFWLWAEESSDLYEEEMMIPGAWTDD